MKGTKLNFRTAGTSAKRWLGMVPLAVVFALIAQAQDYSGHRGNVSRTGRPTVSPSTPGGTLATTYNDAGRAFLRWWDPVRRSKITLDNDQVDAVGTTIGAPGGAWVAPAPGAAGTAVGFFQANPLFPTYRYTTTTLATSDSDPSQGASAFYTYTINNLVAGEDYELYVSMPVGGTDIDGSPGIDRRFAQRYWVYRVSGLQGGGTDLQVMDLFTNPGTFARLGNGGDTTTRTYVPAGTTLTITLYNTVPINNLGQPVDPGANPGIDLVYADAVQGVAVGLTGTANYASSPIVSEFLNPPPGGGPELYPRRVVTARNEQSVIGSLNRTYDFGALTSFTYNSQDVNDPTFQGRRNMVWSWPFRRPFNTSVAEANRAAVEKRNWIIGPNTTDSRTDQRVVADDLSGGSTFSGNFLSTPFDAETWGPTFLQGVATTGVADARADFEPKLADGRYFIEVWLGRNANGTKAQGVTLQVFQGGGLTDTFALDQTASTGWYRVPFQPETGYQHSEIFNLRVTIDNHSDLPSDLGKVVTADAVRFVRQSDVSFRSTPVHASVGIAQAGGAQRDVIIAPMENGRMYCIEAHGDPNTGNPPQVFWTYPTEVSAGDPNATAADDGKDGIGTQPVGFDISSGFVQNVGGTDLFFVASKNGKVYCIEANGRGDGTAVRRWTWPDDYDPTLPTLPMQPGMRPIKGSVAYGVANGVPVVIVPTQEGRVYALDASGNAATKRTNIVWQYPPAINSPLGPIGTTPVVAFGKVFFNTTLDQTSVLGAVYALDLDTGGLLWSQTTSALGPFASFGASPVAIPGIEVTDTGNFNLPPGGSVAGLDAIVVCDSSGHVASLNQTNGAALWQSTELAAGAVGGLTFTNMTTYDNTQNFAFDVPVVVVPQSNGRVAALHAAGNRNVAGTATVWAYRMEGGDQVGAVAAGGWATGDVHSWLYAGDSLGYFYAWNSINDTNALPITPGDIIGEIEIPPNDPDFDDLNDIIDEDAIVLLSEKGHDDMRDLADAGTLTSTDITNIVAAESVERRHYEFGETLYVLVYNLPELTGNLANYFLEFEMTGSGTSSQRRQIPVRRVTDNPANPNYCLVGLPLLNTGGGSLAPGQGKLQIRAIAPGQRGVQSTPVNLPKPPSYPVDPTWDFYMANPLAIRCVDGNNNTTWSVGYNVYGLDGDGWRMLTDDSDRRFDLFFYNGNTRVDQTLARTEPEGYVGPDLGSMGDPVSHGTPGAMRIDVVDRSLSVLLFGRGMGKVRLGPRDVAWSRANGPLAGVIKPLADNTSVNYPGFEDLPVNVPNTSLDYPDVARDNIGAVKNVFGGAENPLFPSGVELTAPLIANNDRDVYRAKAGYEAQMTRTLVPTNWDVSLNVPRYQPPGQLGYYGSQLVYVDSLQPGEQDLSGEAYRTFGLGLRVATDERMTIQSPTVDVGSLPTGGGYNGGPGFGPINPWDPTTAFGPWDNNFNNLFQPFVVTNEGNVNVLNARVAKYFDDASGTRPVELFAPGLHELAWLDAVYHLHSSLDRRYAASLRVPLGTPGADVEGRCILQKPRPGDVSGTRLNVNPKSRPNTNLRTSGGNLFSTTTIVPSDPKVGVSAPIGTPSGSFIRNIFVFEDSDTLNNPDPDSPTLGTSESYTDPGFNLKFVVREARMTNDRTSKSAPIVEDLLNGTENFAWDNAQPAGLRDGFGNIFTAWASNRVDDGGVPNWLPKTKVDTDEGGQDQWRIYIGSMQGGGNSAGASQSPILDLNGWQANTANRWFQQAAGPLPAEAPNTLFAVDVANGESLEPGSIRFGAPAFPTAGAFNMLEFPGSTGRTASNERYLAFLGEAVRRDQTGNSESLTQVMLSPLTLSANGNVAVGATEVMPFDASTKKSRPSLVQVGSTATVFTTSYAGSMGQIVWSSFTPGGGWNGPGSLRLGSAFESVGGPSATLRRYQNGNAARIGLSFTAKMKGRPFGEVYMARLDAANNGTPRFRRGILNYPRNNYELTADTATGLYWAEGSQWLTSPPDVDPSNPNRCIVVNRLVNGVWTSIWDGNPATYQFDPNSGTVSFTTVLGGKAYVDTTTGSVRFIGAIVTRDMRLSVRSTPTIVRVSDTVGANYRGVSSVFDDRFIGINYFPTNPQRNLLGDLSYWGNEVNLAPAPDSLIRFDRTVLAYTRTSGDGTSSTRPYMKTLRPGIQLPFAIALNANGQPVLFEVTWLDASPGSERFYQLDPGTGRVFFMSGHEDRRVRIRYNAVDDSGVGQGVLILEATVGQITELDEQAVPIEQAFNEANISLAIDPLNGAFNAVNVRRPGLVWMFWTSGRSGTQDVYMQTIAPRFTPRPPSQQ